MWFLAMLSWLVAVGASLVAATSYAVPVVAAITAADVYAGCWSWLRPAATKPGRGLLDVLAIPMLVFTLDNAGRVVHMLGGPELRILL